MPDLSNIAQALKLSADADEATILAAVAELSKSPDTPVSLADQAKAEGMTLLSAEQFAALTEKVNEGVAAGALLAKMTFDSAFDKALSDGRALPAMKDNFVTLHEANPDLALKMLNELPKLVNTSPVGAGGEPGSTLSDDTRDEGAGFSADPDRDDLHTKVLAKMESAGISDYGKALDLVLGA